MVWRDTRRGPRETQIKSLTEIVVPATIRRQPTEQFIIHHTETGRGPHVRPLITGRRLPWVVFSVAYAIGEQTTVK